MRENRAERFYRMHQRDGCFIMANAWDAGSAVLLEQAGFDALGTTSAGIAYSRALPDGAGALSFERALEATREITAAIEVPLSMDSENLYAHEPMEVYANMQRILETGAVGASIERTPGKDGFGDIVKARSPWGGDGPGILVLGHLDTVHPTGTLTDIELVEAPPCDERDLEVVFDPTTSHDNPR